MIVQFVIIARIRHHRGNQHPHRRYPHRPQNRLKNRQIRHRRSDQHQNRQIAERPQQQEQHQGAALAELFRYEINDRNRRDAASGGDQPADPGESGSELLVAAAAVIDQQIQTERQHEEQSEYAQRQHYDQNQKGFDPECGENIHDADPFIPLSFAPPLHILLPAGHRRRQQQRPQREQDENHAADHAQAAHSLQRSVEPAPLREPVHPRQDESAAVHEERTVAHHPRPLVVVRRKLIAHTDVGNAEQGRRRVEKKAGRGQIPEVPHLRLPFREHPDQPEGERAHHRADQDVRFAFAETGTGPVAQISHQGIGDRIPEPRDRKHIPEQDRTHPHIVEHDQRQHDVHHVLHVVLGQRPGAVADFVPEGQRFHLHSRIG